MPPNAGFTGSGSGAGGAGSAAATAATVSTGAAMGVSLGRIAAVWMGGGDFGGAFGGGGGGGSILGSGFGGRTISSANVVFFGFTSAPSETRLPYHAPTACAVSTERTTRPVSHGFVPEGVRPVSGTASASGAPCHCTGRRLSARWRRRRRRGTRTGVSANAGVLMRKETNY